MTSNISLSPSSSPLDCPEVVPPFHCMEGLFITGHIEPPLAGVLVTIVTNSSDPAIEVITDEKGTYKAGPLPGTVHHTVVRYCVCMCW